jgi:hypothetical protein
LEKESQNLQLLLKNLRFLRKISLKSKPKKNQKNALKSSKLKAN